MHTSVNEMNAHTSKLSFFAVLVFALPVTVANAQSAGTLSGYMFGDYYYIANNHAPEIVDDNGFWLRRIYFTYDNSLNDNLSVRLRLQMSSPGYGTNDEGKLDQSSGKLKPSVKDAYLSYEISDNHQITLGIYGTPTWDVVEDVWGYRPVEKTVLDLQGMGSSRDFGVSLKGNLSSGGKLKYNLMLANGAGRGAETNRGKKVLFSLGVYPTDHVIIEAYGDYSDRSDDIDRYTGQGFIAYKADKFRIGAQYAHQVRNVDTKADLDFDVLSVFSSADIGENVSVFGRVDRMFQPKSGVFGYIPFDPSSESTFIVFGLDYSPIENIKLIPNVEIVTYDKNTLDTDVIPRLTFFYSIN